MKETEKYRYLTEYQIKTIKKETTAQILERVNDLYKREQKNKFDNTIYGDIKITILKDGVQLQCINLNQEQNPQWAEYRFADIKDIVYQFQKIYQEGKNNVKAIIAITDEWDETEDTPV